MPNIEVTDDSVSVEAVDTVEVLTDKVNAGTLTSRPLVSVEPQEFVLTSSGIYTGNLSDGYPSWLAEYVTAQLASNGAIDNNDIITDMQGRLSDAESGITQNLTSMQYASTRMDALETTVASNQDGNSAGIQELALTKVTATEALAIATELQQSTFGNDVNAYITNLTSTYADENLAYASDYDTLVSTYNDVSVRIDTLDSVEVTPEGWSLASSKFAVDPDGNIVGWQFSNGSNELSEFVISADKFKVASGTSNAVPFSVDTTTQEAIFQGKVTFTSGGSTTTGTINEAIAANIEQVTVGDKNINITDNLIPTTSLLTDINNAGYQFSGDPIKNADTGIDTFAEVQVTLDADDEVYSPYVDEMVYGYYFRFGVTGVTSLDGFKIVCVEDDTSTTTEQTLVYNMLDGNVLDVNTWYIVDGIINPSTGDATSYNGSVRNTLGEKIGEVQNIAMTADSDKMLLGWVGAMTVSRMKLAKITADTLTGSYATTDYVNTTTIDGGRISTGTIQQNGYDVNDNTKNSKWNLDTGELVTHSLDGSFVLDATAAGTSLDPNVQGAYIKGGTVENSILSVTTSTVGNTSLYRYEDFTYVNFTTTATTNTFYTDSIRLVSSSYLSGLINNRIASFSGSSIMVQSIGAFSNTYILLTHEIQYSTDGGSWYKLDTMTNGYGSNKAYFGNVPTCTNYVDIRLKVYYNKQASTQTLSCTAGIVLTLANA